MIYLSSFIFTTLILANSEIVAYTEFPYGIYIFIILSFFSYFHVGKKKEDQQN